MTKLFEEDFESADPNFTKWPSKIISGGEALTLTLTAAHGTNALAAACDGLQTSEWAYLEHALAAPGSELWARVYALFDKLPTRSGTEIPLMTRASWKSGMALAWVSITTNGFFELRWNDAIGEGYITTTVPVRLGTTWHCVEIHVRVSPIGAATGIVELYIDGALAASKLGIDNSKAHVTNENLGTGDGIKTRFNFLQNKIPLQSPTPPKIYLAGVLQGSGYTIDYTAGTVSFATAPATGVVITAAYEFALGNPALVEVGERRWMEPILTPAKTHTILIDDVVVADAGPIGPVTAPNVTLVVNSNPELNVHVYVDGVLAGTTPLTLQVPSGTHTVRVDSEITT